MRQDNEYTPNGMRAVALMGQNREPCASQRALAGSLEGEVLMEDLRGGTKATAADAVAYLPCPLIVDLAGRPACVVGGGRVAERKVRMLLGYGARITVVSPKATDFLRQAAAEGRLAWKGRPYLAGDAAGAALVVCAADEAAVNAAARDEALRNNQLVNIADGALGGNVAVPSVARRGRLQVAVSTSGAAPGLAREVRRELEDHLPPYLAEYVDFVGALRTMVRERVPGPAENRLPLYEAVAKSDLSQCAAEGRLPGLEEAYERIVLPKLKEMSS